MKDFAEYLEKTVSNHALCESLVQGYHVCTESWTPETVKIKGMLSGPRFEQYRKMLSKCGQFKQEAKAIVMKPELAMRYIDDNLDLFNQQEPVTAFSNLQEVVEFLIANPTDAILKVKRLMKAIGMNIDPDNARYFETDHSGWIRNPEPITNWWLVHNSSHALDIVKNGFSQGSSEYSLGQSGNMVGDVGYAFKLLDAPGPQHRSIWAGCLPYTQAVEYIPAGSVVFQGSGMEIRHTADKEEQVLFNIHQPHDFFLIAKDPQNKMWTVLGKNENPLYRSKRYQDCTWWIYYNNYQYKNQMWHV